MIIQNKFSYDFHGALGDTIKEKMEGLYVFLAEEGIESPVRCGRLVWPLLQASGSPPYGDHIRFGRYDVHLDRSLATNEIVDNDLVKVVISGLVK